MSSEYEKLREEIITWQERRVTIFTGAITLLVGLLAYILSNPAQWSWAAALSIELLVVLCGSLFSWFAGYANSIAGAYIAVFHPGEQWERVSRELRRRRPLMKWININSVFSVMYLLFLAASSPVLVSNCTEPVVSEVVTMVVLMVLCAALLACNLLPRLSYPRESFIGTLEKIKSSSTTSQSPPAPPSVPPSSP